MLSFVVGVKVPRENLLLDSTKQNLAIPPLFTSILTGDGETRGNSLEF